MALLALALSAVRDRPRLASALMLLGVFGAALFYGDAVLTPAISVLSAVEGLAVGTKALEPYVVPLAVGILAALFALQRFGTRVVGMLFGPVCLLWFAAIAAAGAWNVAQEPGVLEAIDPRHALRFATQHGAASFLVLGSVLLAFTGAEALYADVGHFGTRAMRLAWFSGRRAGARDQLLRPGRPPDGAPGGDRQSVLPRVPGLGALPDGGAGDRRDGHRVAGDDLRCVLVDAASHPARLPAAHGDRPHVGKRPGPDLHPGGELASCSSP